MLPKLIHKNFTKSNTNFLFFNADDGLSNAMIRDGGDWEEHIKEKSRELLKGVDQPTVIDIGANLGAYCIPIAKEIQSMGGTVHVFEPQRIVYYQLCANIVLNRLDNVYAFNQAVGDYDGMINIPDINYEHNPNIGAFSFVKQYRDAHGLGPSMSVNNTQVPIIQLDSLTLPTQVDLIKIDVEGFEINVLRGSADFLMRNGYPPILFEVWNFEWFKEGKQEIFDWLVSAGYEITSLNGIDHLAKHP